MTSKWKRIWWRFWPCRECGAMFFEECSNRTEKYQPRHSALV